MPSVDVQQELAAIFDRLERIDRQIDEVEADLRRQSESYSAREDDGA